MNSLITVVVLGLVAASLAAPQTPRACPKIVTRAEWGAKPATTSALTTFPPSHVIIHHAASAACTTQSACSAQVRAFQDQHINSNGWADIGYNFLIGEDGNVYEGRGWGKTGAHAPNFNSKSIGICFIGTFTSKLPTAAALKLAHDLIDCGTASGQISGTYKLAGHRQVTSTECPGNTLYADVQKWSHWTSAP